MFSLPEGIPLESINNPCELLLWSAKAALREVTDLGLQIAMDNPNSEDHYLIVREMFLLETKISLLEGGYLILESDGG